MYEVQFLWPALARQQALSLSKYVRLRSKVQANHFLQKFWSKCNQSAAMWLGERRCAERPEFSRRSFMAGALDVYVKG